MAPVHPPATDYAGYAYASLLIFGGLMGAIRRGSVISLAAGGLSGLWAAYGALRVSRDRHDVYVSLGVAWLLAAVMGLKFARNFKFMPAGLVMLVSVIMGTYYSLSIADQGDFSHMEFKDRL